MTNKNKYLRYLNDGCQMIDPFINFIKKKNVLVIQPTKTYEMTKNVWNYS